MENKASFLLYADYIDTFSDLSFEDAGKLINLIFEYVNDRDPDESKHGPLVKIAFIPIKKQLKRDLVKWNETRGKRSEAGIKSAEARKRAKESEQNGQVLTSVKSVEQNPTKRTVTVNDTVNGKEGGALSNPDDEFYEPSEHECIMFFQEKGFNEKKARKFFNWYSKHKWNDKLGRPIQFWKDTAIEWFDENSKVQGPLSEERKREIMGKSKSSLSRSEWDELDFSGQKYFAMTKGGNPYPFKQ